MVVVSAAGREKCTRQFVQNARRNARCLLNPAETDQFTAKIATQNAKIPAGRYLNFRLTYLQ